MQPFITHTGRVAALPRANVDTDQIIPKQFLKRIERTGFGPSSVLRLALSRRRLAQSRVRAQSARGRGRDHSDHRRRTSAAARRASTRPGRSAEYGFRAIIAPSFADIFYGNCCQNGLLPVVLPEAEVAELFAARAAAPAATS